MPPTILYDGLNLSLDTGTGIATYARALIEAARKSGYRAGVAYAVPERGSVNPLLRHVTDWARARSSLYGRSHVSPPEPADGRFTKHGAGPLPAACDEVRLGRAIFRRARLHFEARGTLAEFVTPRPEVAHFTAPIPARVKGACNVYTIHDLVPLRVPGTIGGSRETYFRLHREIARTADHIVTVSEASRRDIIELLGVVPVRVSNTYQSVSVPVHLRSLSSEEVAAGVGVFGLEPGRYLLFFGAIEPKKNVRRLLEAYLSSAIDLPLVIVSSSGWNNEPEIAIINDPANQEVRGGTGLGGPRLKHLSYVERGALVSLIRSARCVALPSLYEGFGLPILEAMLLGTPVLTSNVSSIPEVAGDAALLVDPTDVEAIRRGLVALTSDDDLCRELSRRGLVQADKFSPERYRARVVALYSGLGYPPPAAVGLLA